VKKTRGSNVIVNNKRAGSQKRALEAAGLEKGENGGTELEKGKGGDIQKGGSGSLRS